MPFSAVEDAIAAVGRGEIVVVVDDEDRENEGDLIMAADAVTPEKIAFFLAHTSGLICVPLTPERVEQLDLPLMVTANTEVQRTAFTVSVDFRHGTTTGISAADRSATIQALVDPHTRPTDLNRPGHIFPLRYRPGGVLKRAGHTEAAVDLARAAGHVAGRRAVRGGQRGQGHHGPTARARGLRRRSTASTSSPSPTSSATAATRTSWCGASPTPASRPTSASSPSTPTSRCWTASTTSPWSRATSRASPTPWSGCTRECLTGDVFGSLRCDCGPQLHGAMSAIDDNGSGVLVYLRGHEGRGIGLAHKLRAYSLQEEGFDTVDANLELGLPADSREYGIGAQILVDLGVTTMRLMTNNPTKYGGLEGFGLDIVERVNIQPVPTPENIEYLRTKRERMGHLLEGLDDVL